MIYLDLEIQIAMGGSSMPLYRQIRLNSDVDLDIVVEGSYVPKLAEMGVLCMPASFVTYQRPQGLMQDCLRHWA